MATMIEPAPTNEKAFYANIWIAGSRDVAVEACRQFCRDTPSCVTVTATTFVYAGGAEDGVCVRFIQYPRFPAFESEIRGRARKLAKLLRRRLCQRTYSIEFTDQIEWHPGGNQ